MKHSYLKQSMMLKSKLGGYLKLLSLVTLFSLLQLKASAISVTAVYMEDSDPWGNTSNQTAMNNVFTPGGWQQYNYSTPVATIFNASIKFVMMEGSEQNSNLPIYLAANQTAIENWVTAGGRLFINAAPNYGGSQNWGFGGTTLVYSTPTTWQSPVTTAVPGHQIFLGPYTPTATSFTGNYVAHAYISGSGLTTLLYGNGNTSFIDIGYKKWGSGVVFFGGCTQPGFWSPYPQSLNVWQNIFSYVNAIPLCFNVTCHADTTIYPGLSCATVVNFTVPTASYTCAPPAPDTFFYTGSINTWTVPVGFGAVRIEARGAQGGNNTNSAFGPGLGAIIKGDFALTPGSQLKILVGQQLSATTGNGGGGGSFVTNISNSPMIIAGGGGGSSNTSSNPNKNGNISTTGGNGINGGGAGGAGGNGGAVGANPYQSGAGGGLLTNGANGSDGINSGGKAFVNGGAGGINGSIATGNGGFGGAGCGSNINVGGAGGGYSGGGSGSTSPGPQAGGGGGGSYNGGSNQVNTAGANTGNGMVIITPQAVITSTLMAGLPPGSAFPVGTTTETYRITDGIGDTAYCTFNITIADTATPTISCPANVNTCTSVVTGIAPTLSGTNACSNVTYTFTGATTGSGVDDASGTNFNVGNTFVKYKVVNANGNADSCSFTVSIGNPTGLLAGNNASPESITVDVVAPVDVRYTDCDLMASIVPSGINPVSGNTLVKVTLDAPLDYFNGQPYVSRHFDIEPGTSASSATASLSLFAYQFEFDQYNLAAGPLGLPLLPTGGVDNGNVVITQFHGVGTAPGNYPGPEELIYPSVSWDATYHYWVMTFPVSGFSGFYIHTTLSGPLVLQISNISAINKGARNRVDWTTATEAKGDVMTLERSTDGSTFTALTEMPAKGQASNYTYWDEKPITGVNYYRVKLTNANRDVKYTRVVNATVKNTDKLTIAASPNPVLNKVMVNISGTQQAAGTLQVSDPAGKELLKVATEANSAVIDMSGMPSGIYFIKYTDDSGSVTTRITKQ